MAGPRDGWKIAVNERYQKLVDLMIGLATGSLVLPPLFLKTFLSVPDKDPLLIYLDTAAYLAFSCFVATIALGICFHYTSVKWVKHAWGQPGRVSAKALERILDWSFCLMAAAFIGGLVSFGWFVTHS